MKGIRLLVYISIIFQRIVYPFAFYESQPDPPVHGQKEGIPDDQLIWQRPLPSYSFSSSFLRFRSLAFQLNTTVPEKIPYMSQTTLQPQKWPYNFFFTKEVCVKLIYTPSPSCLIFTSALHWTPRSISVWDLVVSHLRLCRQGQYF